MSIPKEALIIEDEPAVAALLSRILRKAGFVPTMHFCGTEQLLRGLDRFKIVFVDVNLGSDDGVALAERIRAEAPGLAIHLMSANPGNAARVAAAGFPPMLGKPFVSEALKEVLESAGA